MENVVVSVVMPLIQINISPQSSGLKRKPSQKQAETCWLLASIALQH
jgi:hypothetical protein